jgi:hypothetical protein
MLELETILVFFAVAFLMNHDDISWLKHKVFHESSSNFDILKNFLEIAFWYAVFSSILYFLVGLAAWYLFHGYEHVDGKSLEKSISIFIITGYVSAAFFSKIKAANVLWKDMASEVFGNSLNNIIVLLSLFLSSHRLDHYVHWCVAFSVFNAVLGLTSAFFMSMNPVSYVSIVHKYETVWVIPLIGLAAMTHVCLSFI